MSVAELIDLLAGADQGTSGVVFLLAFVGVFVVLAHRRQKRIRRRLLSRRFPILARRRNFTTRQRRQIYARDKGRCRYCGVKVHFKTDCKWRDGCNHDFHADHLIAHSDGGLTTVANGVAACAFHNQSKGAKPVRQWLATSRHRRRGRTVGAPWGSGPFRDLPLRRDPRDRVV